MLGATPAEGEELNAHRNELSVSGGIAFDIVVARDYHKVELFSGMNKPIVLSLHHKRHLSLTKPVGYANNERFFPFVFDGSGLALSLQSLYVGRQSGPGAKALNSETFARYHESH